MFVTAERKRDGGIETPAWWPDRAAAAKRDLGLSNDEIAALAARSLGVSSIDPSRVSRCLSGYTATIPLLGAISDVLGIPSPVIVAESEVEAMAAAVAVAGARRRSTPLEAADAAIAALCAMRTFSCQRACVPRALCA